MVLDTPIIIAILFQEPGWLSLTDTVGLTGKVVISAACYLETRIVIQRHPEAVTILADFEAFLQEAGVMIVPIDEQQARIAAEAYATYGKGRHPAGLNFGDCFSYALAKHMNQPLLFRGNDFSQTDVVVAVSASWITRDSAPAA